jgi:hypothetical protein
MIRAAALATGCRVEIHKLGETHDLRQNKALGEMNDLTLMYRNTKSALYR